MRESLNNVLSGTVGRKAFAILTSLWIHSLFPVVLMRACAPLTYSEQRYPYRLVVVNTKLLKLKFTQPLNASGELENVCGVNFFKFATENGKRGRGTDRRGGGLVSSFPRL